MAKFRVFDKSDWYTYAGAQKFDNGDDPVICQSGSADIIVSGNDTTDKYNRYLVEVNVVNENKNTTSRVWHKEFTSRSTAVKFAEDFANQVAEIDADQANSVAKNLRMQLDLEDMLYGY